MNDGRNILSDDKAKALQEIIEQEEAGRATERNCTNCRKWAECMEGPLTPGEMRHATCWAPESKAAEQAQQIKQHLTETRLTPSTEELLEGVRLPETPSTAAEAHERARREFELHEAGRRAYQEPLERLAKEIDRRLERLLTERYPGTPIEAFISSFIPGGLRITAPDGAVFDFVYTTHGPSTAGGTTTMTMDLTVTETKIGGEQE